MNIASGNNIPIKPPCCAAPSAPVAVPVPDPEPEEEGAVPPQGDTAFVVSAIKKITSVKIN